MVIYLIDRQAHAIDRYRPLVRQIFGQVLGHVYTQVPGFAHGLEPPDFTHSVDMARDQMAVERITQPQGMLEIDLARRLEPRGASQTFSREDRKSVVEGKSVTLRIDLGCSHTVK